MLEYLLIAILGFFIGFSIFCVVLFSYLANRYRQSLNEKRARDRNVKRKKSDFPFKDDEFLSKDKVRAAKKVVERRKEVAQEHYAELEVYNEMAKNIQQDKRIVGIAEPPGKFSRFIQNQKIGFILLMGGLQSSNEGKKAGYWQNLIKAQEMAAGKDKSKGR